MNIKYSFDLIIELPDNSEHTYEVPVAGVLEDKFYILSALNNDNGLIIFLHSHSNNIVKIRVFNNTGLVYNNTISLSLLQI